ncbi:hypothetical protein JCM6882_002481 [Rhodosporidiobolus microsporus]
MQDPVPPEIVELAASLHRADLAELDDKAKGKGKEGDLSAEQQAFLLYARELDSVEQVLADERFARSLDSAVTADGQELEAVQQEEEQARRDHQLALALSEGRPAPHFEEHIVVDTTSTSPSPISPAIPSSSPSLSSPLASTSTIATSSLAECLICTERVPVNEGVHVPCPSAHFYCGSCIRHLFLAATKDESLFPPRCDGVPIPLKLASPHLSLDDLAVFRRKSVEFTTPNKLYCSRPSCSAFLGGAQPDGHEGKVAVKCDDCGTETCRACKAPWHGERGLCGAGGDDEAAEVLTRDKGYRRCERCKRMVELKDGCNHITCLCRHQFCYVCGSAWETCHCPLFDEASLLRAAEHRVAAEDAVRRPAFGVRAAPRAARVAQAMANLEVNHDCLHTGGWYAREGGGECEFCLHYLPQYLLVS